MREGNGLDGTELPSVRNLLCSLPPNAVAGVLTVIAGPSCHGCGLSVALVGVALAGIVATVIVIGLELVGRRGSDEEVVGSGDGRKELNCGNVMDVPISGTSVWRAGARNRTCVYVLGRCSLAVSGH